MKPHEKRTAGRQSFLMLILSFFFDMKKETTKPAARHRTATGMNHHCATLAPNAGPKHLAFKKIA